MTEFVSIIWGYHSQLFTLAPVENYHLEAIRVAQDLGYKTTMYLIGARAKVENDPHIPPGVNIVYHQSVFGYLKFLWSKRSAIIYANTFTSLSFLPLFFSRRTVFMGHDSVTRKTWLKQCTQDLLLKKFSRVRVISEDEREFLLQHGLAATQVMVAPLALDVELFSSVPEGKRSGLVFLGNVTPDKDGITILKALALARKEIPAITLDVFGEVRDPEFTRLLIDLELSSQVKLHGFVPHAELPRFLGDFSIYVNSSISEGQCLAVYEAALSGLAVCLPSTLSFRSVFKNAALFHDLYDDKMLAANIVNYLKNSALRTEHVAQAHTFIAKNYTRDVVNARVRELFSF